MAKLVFTSGPEAGKEVPLSDTQIIGRLPTNAVPIKDEGSSRQNTRLYRSAKTFAVIDLNSKNGTFVNNEQVQRADLKDGDIVRIGSTTFRFEAGPEIEPPGATPAKAARGAAPLTGSPDEVIQYGGVGSSRNISEKAIRVTRQTTTSGGALRWMRADFSQHPFLYKTLLLLGVLLLMSGIAFIAYRFTAA